MSVEVQNLPDVIGRRDHAVKLTFLGMIVVEVFWVAFLIWLPLRFLGIV